ncbi:hypothetical protein PR048_012122 [Dryococelus australis]|uniref:DDE Tnp4 domain-containing protein n=1 Tax=Dryococelus australis TaxID=614101 RepID=A0ABQ9HNG5_9NEOP|nr:hypothetical protein PR048_012122 [Dryococelus australis]
MHPQFMRKSYVNRYGDHLFNVMVICGPDYKFYSINANWPGSVHDARVLRNPDIYNRFETDWKPYGKSAVLHNIACNSDPNEVFVCGNGDNVEENNNIILEADEIAIGARERLDPQMSYFQG